MRTTLILDSEIVNELKRAESVTRARRANLLRQAIWAGLPLVVSRYQAPRPEGFFADCYPRPKDRQELEVAMARVAQKRRV